MELVSPSYVRHKSFLKRFSKYSYVLEKWIFKGSKNLEKFRRIALLVNLCKLLIIASLTSQLAHVECARLFLEICGVFSLKIFAVSLIQLLIIASLRLHLVNVDHACLLIGKIKKHIYGL